VDLTPDRFAELRLKNGDSVYVSPRRVRVFRAGLFDLRSAPSNEPTEAQRTQRRQQPWFHPFLALFPASEFLFSVSSVVILTLRIAVNFSCFAADTSGVVSTCALRPQKGQSMPVVHILASAAFT